MDITTEELFYRYNEEADILNDKNSLAVILFGSRASDNYKNGSDLDILVITPDIGSTYSRQQRIIDGIPVEIIKMSKETLEQYIKSSARINSTFYESLFSECIVKKNNNSIVEEEIKLVETCKKKSKQKSEYLRGYWEKYLDQGLYKYRHADKENKQLYYYAFIEHLRMIYTVMNGLSEVASWKCFDVYTNEEKAERYKVDLPSQEFIDSFVSALNPTNMELLMKSLFHFVNYKDYLEDNRCAFFSQEYRTNLSKEEQKKDLMWLGKNVNIVEDKILFGSKDANYVYFLLLAYMREKYLRIGPQEENNFENQFNIAISITGGEERIRMIEELLHTITSAYQFDFDDYTL